MTEIPEHLLRRSRERRAALSGGGAPESAGADEGGGEAPAAPAPAATPARAEAAAPAPVAAAAAPAVVVDEPPSPILLAEQAARRTRIPWWATPVLVALPFWAVLYAGAFGERHTEEVVDPAVLGPRVYAASCAGCHGGQGEGGSGPALAGGEATRTFPDPAAHVDWVRTGSSALAGQPYGDPNRPGGQRRATGGMPGFAGTLTPAEIDAVVRYEREGL